MIKGSQLMGRAVIDMEAAERLGKIKEIIVQRDGERVAGFIVVHGETIVGTGGTRQMIPASAVYSIGPDAMTVRGSAMKQGLAELENLPRMSDIIGHKMVTRSGRLLGVIDDMLVNGADGTVIGFVVGEGVRNKLENIFNPQRPQIHGYVRADADLHVGRDLIVVPDDALIFRDGKVFVPIVRADRLHLADVSLGYDNGQTVEILEGLQGDEMVAMNVGQTAREGDPVRPIRMVERQ